METGITPDEFCNNCAETRKDQGLEKNRMIPFPEKTLYKNETIGWCPTCDRGEN